MINAKISLASFIYDCIDTICFPNDETKQIYAHHKIIKILSFLLMTDTDSASLDLIAIAKDSCDCGEWKMSDILLRIVLENDNQYRLDLSGEFWQIWWIRWWMKLLNFDKFNKRNNAVRKQVGLYEFENIEHGIVCVICVNPKEYLELYGIFYKTNKKHKGVRKGIKGMECDNYTSWILTIKEAEEDSRRFAKKQKQTRF